MTDQQWFIRKDGVIHGPATVQDLKNLLDANRINLQIEAGQSKDGPWRELGEYPDFAPVRPIADLFAAPGSPPAAQPPVGISYVTSQPSAPSTPISIPQAPVIQSATAPKIEAAAIPGAKTLSDKGRIEFISGLEVEVNRQIEDKATPASLVVGGLVVILIAKFNMAVAFILGFITAGIAFKIAKAILQDKYLRPIYDFSDEMLVTRYNEAKADRRAARTRTAISWAVIVVIAVVIAIAWFAAHRQ